MRFQSIAIQNFRAIREFRAADLADLVVIAGPNGCGKSCILDSMRLLKSVYGGYQSNEWLMWFGEFQVNLGDQNNLLSLFRDKQAPLTIRAQIQIAASEAAYLMENAEKLCEPLVWHELTGVAPETFGYSSLAYAAQFPARVGAVAQQTALVSQSLRTEAAAVSHSLELSLTADGRLSTTPSTLARVLFATYDPQNLGIIDFHSASRSYAREALGGVNLDVKAIETTRRTQALYNSQAKYSNVKTELVTMYIRSLVARNAGADANPSQSLDDTLKELFKTFFPDKEYLGVQSAKDGTITFPVKLPGGEVHDINDLSSGEKEVLYGYLRLRSSTPENSTILLDEPELHLNPGLLQGFPDFYYRHLSQTHGNQLWLVTHSDALLRQAVGNPNYSVFHMTNASGLGAGENQAVLVEEDELQAALLDLVGDLAAYRPTGKVLIFEGGGDTDFDVTVVRRLFPALATSCNLVSGGSKGKVRDLYVALQNTAQQTGLADRFYALTDRDGEVEEKDRPLGGHVLSWDVYHIENYLLEPAYVYAAYVAIVQNPVLQNAADAEAALKRLAEQGIARHVLIRLQDKVNREVMQSINIGAAPDSSAPTLDLLPSITATFDRLDALRATVGDQASLEGWEAEYTTELRGTITDGSWVKSIPGRTILRAFVTEYLHGVASYDGFVNLIVNQMVTASFQPQGMLDVLRSVVPGL